MTKPKKLPTIAMTPMPEYGYDPIPLILSGEKKHTLRKHQCFGRREVTVSHKRVGIILEFHRNEQLTRTEFLTAAFAIDDGFRNSNLVSDNPKWIRSPLENLQAFLTHFYGKVPETMWCNHFRVVERPADRAGD